MARAQVLIALLAIRVFGQQLPAALAEALAAHCDVLRLTAAEAGESVWRPSKRRGAARRKAT